MTKRSYPGDDRPFTEDELRAVQKRPTDVQLSPAMEDIRGVIRAAGRRLTTREVLLALETFRGAASEGTAKSNLATMTRFGVLTNAKDDKGRGYGLPEWD